MIILLLIFITVYLLFLAGDIVRVSKRNMLTFSLVMMILCQITWLWNVGVLYMVDTISPEESEFWFRLTRIGSLMTPTFFFLTVTQAIKYSQEDFGFFNKLFTKVNFYIYLGITLVFYSLNWTTLTIEKLHLETGGLFDLYFPEYGSFGWIQLFQISTLMIWLIFSIVISLKMKNVYVRSFMLPLSTLGIIASAFGLMSFLRDLVIITNILSITSFTVIIQYSFNRFREKVFENQQLKEIEKMKRNYIDYSTSSLVHELRNPLSVLQGYFYLLNKNKKLDEESKRILVVLERSSGHIQSVLDNFVDFIHTKEVKLKRVNAMKLIENSIAMMDNKAKENGVKIYPFIFEKHIHLNLDESKFSQVLINLYKNAIEELQHVEGKKEIHTNVHVEGNEFRLEIRDTGRGMPQHVRENVFQPFKTFKENGMGLGLSICSNIISAHKGEIIVKESSEKGTVFLITLPVEDYTELFIQKD